MPAVTGSRPGIAVSVIIAALDEARSLPALLADLRGLGITHEVIVADGGSTDGTPELARAAGATVIAAPRGRGAQFAAGARAATADVLCFLHADVRVSARALGALERVARSPMRAAWAFPLRIGARGAGFRIIERGANLRSRWLRLPYGDQGLVVSRAAYDDAGGFPEIPLMEDVTLVRALARRMPVRLMHASITVSARRWRREGLVRATLRNWTLLAGWWLGVAPERLARRYRTEAAAPGPPDDRR